MSVEDILQAVETILQDKPLASIQYFVLSQSWLGKTYGEMAEESGYRDNYIKEVGSELWQDLSVALGKKITKKNLHLALQKYLQDKIGNQKNQSQQDFVEKEAREQGAGSRGEGSDGDSTPPEREPLNRSEGLRPMFRSAPRQGEGVIFPCSLPPSPCLFVEESSLEMVSPDFFSASKIEFPSGPVPLGSPLYINRPPLEELVCNEILYPGCLIRIKAPRKTGKSSLLNRMIAYAREQGYQIVYLDFQEADEGVFASLDKFLRWFCVNVSRQLNLFPCLDDFWDTEMGSKVSCKIYFEAYLLQYIDCSPLVLALNEVHRVFEHPNIAQDFLPMLRFWHEQAKQDQLWQKLRMVVVHTTEIYIPLKLNQSPFNVGITITLPPLTLNQVQNLALRYGLNCAADTEGAKRLAPLQAMVGGHPYLVSLALYHLCQEEMTLEVLLETASTPVGIYSQHLRELLSLLQKEPELMSAMQQVIATDEKVELDAIAAYKLESMGLVKLNGNQAQVMCELYRLYFSQQLGKHSG